jgi:hypothetical protein
VQDAAAMLPRERLRLRCHLGARRLRVVEDDDVLIRDRPLRRQHLLRYRCS